MIAEPAHEDLSHEIVPVPQLEPVPDFMQAPAVAAAPVEAVAETSDLPEVFGEPSHSVIESAAAAAVGVVGAGLGYVVTHHGPEHVVEAEPIHADSFVEPPLADAPAEVAVEPVAVESPMPTNGTFGDAALAEELAAAMAHKEAEEHANAAVDAVTVAAAMEPFPGSDEPHTYSDSKLSSAVARALERLKPQLIVEILKELTNKQ